MDTQQFISRAKELHSLLFAFALRLTGNQEDAKDLMQDTAIKAFKGRERFIEGSNFKAWITTIMRNTFINNYRKRRTRRHINQNVIDSAEIFDKRMIANEGEQSVRMLEMLQMLDGIGEIYSMPFIMFYKGYGYQEIADHLNIPIGTVKSRIFTARMKLKKLVVAD